jgi:Lrp/AsnC family transcriptional regulator, leucine-responsive regulatory protein
MDRIDREILRALESDARISYKDLAERVSLSANSVADRVRRLRERGVIRGFTTNIDPGVFGLTLRALIEVKLESGTTAVQFESRAAATPGVIRAFVTTGRYDWVLEVLARDQLDLQHIVDSLRADGLARETYSRIIATDRHFGLRFGA